MYPIEGSLCIRKSRLQTAKAPGVWSCAETDTVHDPGKANVRLRQAQPRVIAAGSRAWKADETYI